VLTPAIYSHRNCDAARHLFRVTAGLESMVVGEAEIQGQVKRAYQAALAQDAVGPLTGRLFKAALATGKRVRTQTAIGERNLSLPAVAVGLARELLGSLDGRCVVIVGTGETSELTARALTDSGAEPVFVASRRRDRAIGLARRYGGSSVSFDELPTALGRADIVVAATASPHLLLEAEELAEVMRGRPERPLLLIDLAVPRDIDAACAELGGVSLYDIDDLDAVVARNRRVRQAEARKAEGIIEEEIQQFAAWLGSLEVLPTLAALRARATEIAEQVLRENQGKWESASPRDLERLDAIARAIVNRLLHEPTLRMKELRDDRAHARMALLRELFDLEVGEVAEPVADSELDQLAEVRELRRR
jgi:glutamyl-tRNA reductase